VSNGDKIERERERYDLPPIKPPGPIHLLDPIVGQSRLEPIGVSLPLYQIELKEVLTRQRK
jgi:hypothetical protein